MKKRLIRIQRAIAEKLLKAAMRLDEGVLYKAFDKPSINIFCRFEHGNNLNQTFEYKTGEDAKCLGGITKLLGHNPFEGFLQLMNEGLVKNGDTKADIRVESDKTLVNGEKYEETP